MYKRRWKGWKKKEVSERMSMVASNRFKDTTVEERKDFSRAGVEARGTWKIINGERKYVRKSK